MYKFSIENEVTTYYKESTHCVTVIVIDHELQLCNLCIHNKYLSPGIVEDYNHAEDCTIEEWNSAFEVITSYK